MQLDNIRIDMLKALNEKPRTKYELKQYNERLLRNKETIFEIQLQFLIVHQLVTILNDDKYYIKDAGRAELKKHVAQSEAMPLPEIPKTIGMQERSPGKKRLSIPPLSDTGWKIFLIGAIYSAGHIVGYFHNNFRNYTLENKIEGLEKRIKEMEDSLRPFRPALNITNVVTTNDTTNNNKKNQDTHSAKKRYF